jgi:hypothetical protein
MKRFGAALSIIILACLAGSGCGTPEFSTPLTAYSADSQDRTLLGSWLYREKPGAPPGFIHIGLNEDLTYFRIVAVGRSDMGKLESFELSAHSSILAGRRYLNVRQTDTGQKPPAYAIIKYQVDDGHLTFWLMNDNPLATAVATGTIEGEVIPTKWLDSIRVTDSPQRVQAFIVKHDPKLFVESSRLDRLSP